MLLGSGINGLWLWLWAFWPMLGGSPGAAPNDVL
jgi:hypothetical protein